MEYKEGQILANQTAIELSYEGYGVIRDANKYPIFVENMLINEIADIKLFKVTQNYSYARVLNFIKFSPDRIDTNNPKLLNSGSAPLLILSYENQLKFKQKIVNSLFSRQLKYDKVKEIIPSPSIFNYRNKLTVQVESDEKGVKFGFYQKNSHTLIEQDSYDLASKEINDLLVYINKIVNEKFDENSWVKKTLLNTITIKFSKKTNELQIILGCKNSQPIDKKFINSLVKKYPKISIIKLTYKDDKNKFGKYVTLANKNKITYKVDKLKFAVLPSAFYQVNELQMHKMYNHLQKSLNLTGSEYIVDAYSGVGTIGMFLTNKARKVICVEVNKQSIECGKLNSRSNGLTNVEFVHQDATRFFDRDVINKDKFDIVVFDPPREGLNKNIINVFHHNKIKKIAYISCNPRTLVRDLELIINKGYEIKEVQPFDMFPHTYHIETLVILELKEE
ncbi:23S rRNA (uracil(1939)-C(5))-methyltransferase RlmD [Metamycoplasma buccale]|uniref:23S rRNA (uracil(1939)-C(5))-methyltransferase RlmD n=1 Tax=Metamycoplasma buccale TaxID=55602 RepID=UPI00398F7C68